MEFMSIGDGEIGVEGWVDKAEFAKEASDHVSARLYSLFDIAPGTEPDSVSVDDVDHVYVLPYLTDKGSFEFEQTTNASRGVKMTVVWDR